MDELIERLRSRLLESGAVLSQRTYLLDGSSLQLEHESELEKAYPPASNQHGKSHWPVVRIVVLHDLETGLAERPYWGPFNGRKAVSEQALAKLAMEHVPSDSVIVGDRNFGIFSTAYHTQQSGHKAVVRLTAVRAKSLWGGPISRQGEYTVRWRPSRWDGRNKNTPQAPPWPADASVEGRLIAWRVGRGKYKQWLYLFTTTSLPAEEVVALYGRRWQIETDLRSLKQTVSLYRICAHSAEMMEKELMVAVMAYNLVRAIMFQAARRAQIDPRQLSFTYACNIVLDGYAQVLAARARKTACATSPGEDVVEMMLQVNDVIADEELQRHRAAIPDAALCREAVRRDGFEHRSQRLVQALPEVDNVLPRRGGVASQLHPAHPVIRRPRELALESRFDEPHAVVDGGIGQVAQFLFPGPALRIGRRGAGGWFRCGAQPWLRLRNHTFQSLRKRDHASVSHVAAALKAYATMLRKGSASLFLAVLIGLKDEPFSLARPFLMASSR
jgi:hypothetical protein